MGKLKEGKETIGIGNTELPKSDYFKLRNAAQMNNKTLAEYVKEVLMERARKL